MERASEILIGKLHIHQSILVWFALCVIFGLFFYLAGKAIEKADPKKATKGLAFISEGLVPVAEYVMKPYLKDKTMRYIPIIGTLFIMMAAANMMGLFGVQTPTTNVSFNASLAVSAFLTIQYQAIKKNGLVSRAKEFLDPAPLLLPLNLIGELVFPLSLTMRLFGNILAGSIVMMLLYVLMGWLIGLGGFGWLGALGFTITPLMHMYFDLFSGLIQSFVFFTLICFFLGQQVNPE